MTGYYGIWTLYGPAINKELVKQRAKIDTSRYNDEDWFYFRILECASTAGGQGFDLDRLHESLVAPSDSDDAELPARQAMFDAAKAKVEALFYDNPDS